MSEYSVPRVSIDPASIPEAPLAFTCPRDEFVDRISILDDLARVALQTKKRAARNLALIGPRRIGKTAIIERLYNHLWHSQREVVPLYFSFRPFKGRPALETLEQMAQRFLGQYLSFMTDSDDYANTPPDWDAGLNAGQELELKGLVTAIQRINNSRARGHYYEILDSFADLPRTIADTNDSSLVVFLDEFQVITQMLDRDGKSTDLRATFKDAVESPRCTFFISGSAVTLMREHILGRGPLLGRFSPEHIKPLDPYWGLELVRKLAAKYGFGISDELATSLVNYTNAYPYYLNAFMGRLDRVVAAAGQHEATSEQLSTAISIEETEGEINNFLLEQVWGFREKYGSGAWHILGFLAAHDWFDEGLVAQFIEDLISKHALIGSLITSADTIKMLGDLAFADVLETNGHSWSGPYRFGTDPILRLFCTLQYELEVEKRPLTRVRTEERSRIQQTLADLKRMLGYLLESHLKYLMMLWDDREVDGVLFGGATPVRLGAKDAVYDTTVKPKGSRAYQLDVVAPSKHLNEPVWVVECRFRKRKASVDDVVHFAQACAALKLEHSLGAVQGWFVSVEGFTDDALAALREHGIYYSGKKELNALLELFGLRTIAVG